MLASIARGLRFTGADRDRLFSAAGYDESDAAGITHLEPGLMHMLARLADTPAMAVDAIGATVYQTRAAAALFGDHTERTGWARSGFYRWFTDPGERHRHPIEEHPTIAAEIVADLRRSHSRHCRAATELVRELLNFSAEFADLWHGRSVEVLPARATRVVHPALGVLELQREVLFDADVGLRVVIYLAVPGSRNHTALALSSVLGHQRFEG